ncbi:MAG: branched-chain amino acid ABC transporter permease [Fastidiosipilaceae bacterium]|jgi:branched-chain amino acid transport system permease protein|nr:branched-chain amino acid ABC transporter permease [Clostridiaceae bacterium]
MYFLVQLINGLQIGSIYALIALGYTMVYGIIKLINFAHGDIMMVGAYLALLLLNNGIPIIPAMLISMAGCAIFGIIIERLAYKPLRKSSRLSALITAIGVSLLLQNAAMLVFGSAARTFPDLTKGMPSFQLGSNSVNILTVISIVLAIVVMIALQLFVTRSKAGTAMRAVSEDTDAAELMGINVNTTISMTFAIGSGLAAFAAILFCMAYPQVTPYMGAMPGIKAFIAAVLGGIGVIPGAMIGGFILGVIEALTKAYIPSGYSALSDAVVFAILIIVLLVKPSGLLGRPQREKV